MHAAGVRQIFYGGAAGGGKSHALRMGEGIGLCLQNPGLQAYLFRRTMAELEGNHLKHIRQLPRELGYYHETRRQFIFDCLSPPSILTMGYAEDEKDIWNYQGQEMHLLLVDEASKMTGLQLGVLQGWNRTGSWTCAPGFEGIFPRSVFASNPGGPGHEFLKQKFQIGVVDAEHVFYDPSMANPKDPADPGWTTVFIPAKMSDNAFLDPNYAGSFGNLPAELAKAYIDGDWDAVPGAALDILSKPKHQCRAFRPPRHWTHFLAMDWGTARPFSVGWYCVSEGAVLRSKDGWPDLWLPAGAVIRFAEWYGWNGKANEGSRMASQEVAEGILRREREKELPPMDFRVGDSAMWAQFDGPSVAERMLAGGVPLSPSKKDRKAGYAEVRARLAGNRSLAHDGKQGEFPMLFATADCKNFWRTLPSLVLDETDPEKGPAEDQENHVYDELAYALRHRPWVSTEQHRYNAELAEARLAHRLEDPYATARP